MIEVEKVDEEGQIYFFIKGTKILHREDGPAFLKQPGSEIWYRYGKFHREDGPAFISIGVKEWWINGKLHREDGPAKEYFTGKKEWYLYGYYFSTKESWFEALTEEQKAKALYSEYFMRC